MGRDSAGRASRVMERANTILKRRKLKCQQRLYVTKKSGAGELFLYSIYYLVR
jgi:hypothetical protein